MPLPILQPKMAELPELAEDFVESCRAHVESGRRSADLLRVFGQAAAGQLPARAGPVCWVMAA